MLSVVPRTKMISLRRAALRKRRTVVARRLEGVGGALAERVHAAVDVGVVGGVEARDGVDHRRGFCAEAALSR